MILQTNTWICEKCSRIVSESEERSVYSDPLLTYPESERGWEMIYLDNGDDLLLCPACVAEHKRQVALA